MSLFEEKAREIACRSLGFSCRDNRKSRHHPICDRHTETISLALGEAFEAGKGESLRDRAVVNEAPDGSSPFGLPSLSQAEGVWTAGMKSAAMQDAQNVCDLAMIVRKFIRRTEKGLPLDDFARKASDFLVRKGLNGSPLRAADSQCGDGVAPDGALQPGSGGDAKRYPLLFNGDHAEFEAEHANTPPHERPDWPLPSFDAQDWAAAFCKIAKTHGHDIDEGWMIGWFANALMRGHDEGFSRALSQIEEPALAGDEVDAASASASLTPQKIENTDV